MRQDAAVNMLARLAPRCLEIAGLAVLAAALGKLVWLLFAPHAAVSSVTASPQLNSVTVATAAPETVDMTRLTRSNPFAPGAPQLIEEIVDDAPETSLNLILKGSRTATGDGVSSATIVTPDNRQLNYAEGEEILSGVAIHRILSDRVILDKNGEFESLFREGRTGDLSVLRDQTERQEVGGRTQVDPAVFRADSLDALFSNATLERATGPAGWKIRVIGDREMVAAAGFYDNDRLISVNNVSAADMEYEDLTDMLDGAGRLNLSLQRGTKTIQQTLVLEERE